MQRVNIDLMKKWLKKRDTHVKNIDHVIYMVENYCNGEAMQPREEQFIDTLLTEFQNTDLEEILGKK